MLIFKSIFSDDLEPFAREKQLCNTLIQYCQRFTYPEFQADLPQPPADFSNPLPVPTSVTSISEPSSLDAEALALGLFNDERRASGGSGSPGRRRKPHHQTLTKPRQISHADMILEQFSTLEISPPMLYSDAGAVMEVLREKLVSGCIDSIDYVQLFPSCQYSRPRSMNSSFA